MNKRLLTALVLTACCLGGLHVAHTVHAGQDPHPRAAAALDKQLGHWAQAAPSEEVLAMRRLNPEWDFMQRTFLVLALANEALAAPDQQGTYLPVIDRVIEDTLAQEAQHGQHWYLLSYADRDPFRSTTGRSLFVDGEIAVMLGARLILAEDPAVHAAFDARIAVLRSEMLASPSLSAESYPDEVWTFCNSFALVALRMHEVTSGADHSDLTQAWLDHAKRTLIDPETGLLVSSTHYDGRPKEGPEGSSIWLVASNLLLVDPDFAAEQYAGAKEHLGGRVGTMAYAKEWPSSQAGQIDVDSGPILPYIEASASSSGFALLAARAFEDGSHELALRRALDAADLVLALDPELAQMADNPVGEAVLLYAFSFGPLWAHINATPAAAAPS